MTPPRPIERTTAGTSVAVEADDRHERDALDATERYLEELAGEVGEPSARQQARSDALVRRIRDVLPKSIG